MVRPRKLGKLNPGECDIKCPRCRTKRDLHMIGDVNLQLRCPRCKMESVYILFRGPTAVMVN